MKTIKVNSWKLQGKEAERLRRELVKYQTKVLHRSVQKAMESVDRWINAVNSVEEELGDIKLP